MQGVSTRKVKAITEELCGHSFSAASISAINQRLDEALAQFAGRPLGEAFPYLILDARYERVREAGVISSQAVLIAIGIDWDGRRQILAVELANRESRSSWRDFLLALKARGLNGVEFVVADDNAGVRVALREALPEAAYQRCYVHFLRNALDYVPRRVNDDCLQELRWLYDRRDLSEARRDLAAWLGKWSAKYPRLTGWVEENIDETLTPAFAGAGFFTGCRASTISISNRPTCSSASTRRSSAARMSCGSFPMPKAASGWCGRWRSKSMRIGSNSIATSTWTICTSTKRKPCAVPREPRPPQLGTVLARSRPSRALGARWPQAASLDLRCARRRGETRSGRRNGARSNKETRFKVATEPTVTAVGKRDVTIANRRWKMPAHRIGADPMTPAERQARHRAKLRRPSQARSRAPAPRLQPRPQRWAAAIATLVALQDEYRAWLDRLPENLEGSPTAEKLQAITELDLDELLAIDPPRGYGRD